VDRLRRSTRRFHLPLLGWKWWRSRQRATWAPIRSPCTSAAAAQLLAVAAAANARPRTANSPRAGRASPGPRPSRRGCRGSVPPDLDSPGDARAVTRRAAEPLTSTRGLPRAAYVAFLQDGTGDAALRAAVTGKMPAADKALGVVGMPAGVVDPPIGAAATPVRRTHADRVPARAARLPRPALPRGRPGDLRAAAGPPRDREGEAGRHEARRARSSASTYVLDRPSVACATAPAGLSMAGVRSSGCGDPTLATRIGHTSTRKARLPGPLPWAILGSNQ
jgi:hypothetical protein